MDNLIADDAKSILLDECVTVRSALRQLCVTGRQILFVTHEGRLIASVTDGDIRRYLLDGGVLDSAISNAANPSPKFLFSTERERAPSFVRANRFAAVPIVDEDMSVIDVVFASENVDITAVSIRVIVPEDLSMVLEFFDQMAGDTRAMFNRGDVNRIRVVEHLQRNADDGQIHFAAVVKEADGKERMVGYVFLWDIDKKMPWLGIAVREDWKGHHLGRVLLEHLDGWAKPKGYGGLMLTSVPANVRAHALYTRAGFNYYGVYPDSEFLYIKRYEI